MACRVFENERVSRYRAVRLENDLISATILPERGAEVHSLVYAPRGMDVLWKAPWGIPPQRGNDTETLWMDGYAGGWQELFPNGCDACVYKGALLGFHGEASVSEWDCRVVERGAAAVAIELSVKLVRSPFVMRRRMAIEDGRAAIRVDEQITNAGEEDLQYMWGHHPAYGAPFLSGDCRLRIPAAERLEHGGTMVDRWPEEIAINADGERFYGQYYAMRLREGRYDLWNARERFGIRWTWPMDVFPYVHLWQELKGSFGYPWYGRCYVMGVEPFSSIPGSGLNAAIVYGTAPTLAAGRSIEATLTAEFVQDPDS